MSIRISSIAGMAFLAVSIIAAAQSPPIPVPVLPLRPAGTEDILTVDEAMKSHPQQIQSQLKLIAEQFNAAGLVAEANAVRELERRVQEQHFQKLLTLHQESLAKAIEPQISLRLSVLEFERSPETEAALSQLMGTETDIHADGATPTGRTLSGVYDAAKVQAWIKDSKQQGLIRVISEPNLTILNGRRARFQQGAEKLVGSSESKKIGAEKERPQETWFVGTIVEATAQVEKDGLIRMSVMGSYQDDSRGARRIQTAVELYDSQSVVLAGLQSYGTVTEVSRIPVLGDIPIVGPLMFSTKKTKQVTTELVCVISAEIIRPVASHAVPGFGVSPIEPAKFNSPKPSK